MPNYMIRPTLRSRLFPRAGAFVALLFAILATGCASKATRNPIDPLEPMNRAIYKFNDVADRAVLKPTARAYDFVMPGFLKTGIRNFFNNLDDVIVVVNDLLQLKGKEAARDSVRLMANTVFGGLGFVDVAGMRGVTKRYEDFGQTLGYWGVGTGPYLVLPLLGPSNFRDGAARFVDTQIDPVWRVDRVAVRNSAAGVRIVDTRASLLPAEKILEQAADRYVFLRDAYLQRRLSLVYDGNPPRSKDQIDYDELEDEDEEERDKAHQRDLPSIVPPSTFPIPQIPFPR